LVIQGIGTKLLQFAEKLAREWKCRSIVLETQTSNYNAIKFYEKNGLSISGLDLNFYSNKDVKNHEVRLEMSKAIDD
jgi:ribosomal protein S18 acetylase RimI-like enzyme